MISYVYVCIYIYIYIYIYIIIISIIVMIIIIIIISCPFPNARFDPVGGSLEPLQDRVERGEVDDGHPSHMCVYIYIYIYI